MRYIALRVPAPTELTSTKNFNNSINSISKNASILSNTFTPNDDKHILNLQPKNLSVHNLCRDDPPQSGVWQLLGLGLKYCIATPKLNPNLKHCLLKLAYKIRTKHWLLHQNPANTNPYIPQIYVKLKGWNPPPASSKTEDHLTEFEKKLKETIVHHEKWIYYTSNITYSQWQTLTELRNNNKFIIVPTIKNLRPAIMNRDQYIEQCLSEHLLTHQYMQLTKQTAITRKETTKKLLLNNIWKYKNQLNSPELTYLTRSFKSQHRMPIFYGLPKVHKKLQMIILIAPNYIGRDNTPVTIPRLAVG